MSVTVDHESLAAESLGLTTIGHVLSHLQRDNRLVINLLIDGQKPDLGRLGQIRAAPLDGHTLFIETAEPQETRSKFSVRSMPSWKTATD